MASLFYVAPCFDLLSGVELGKMMNRVNEEIWKQSLDRSDSRVLSPASDKIRDGFHSKFGPFSSNAIASEHQFKLSIQQYLQSRINFSQVFLLELIRDKQGTLTWFISSCRSIHPA